MFCDLVDSTKLAAELDPEVYSELVDDYYQVCGEIIGRYNGFVSQYLGDGILAFFGYPEAGETTAEDAVVAALEISRRWARSKAVRTTAESRSRPASASTRGSWSSPRSVLRSDARLTPSATP